MIMDFSFHLEIGFIYINYLWAIANIEGFLIRDLMWFIGDKVNYKIKIEQLYNVNYRLDLLLT